MCWDKLDYPMGEAKKHREEITQSLFQMQEARNKSTQGLDDKQDMDDYKSSSLYVSLVRTQQEFQESISKSIDLQIWSLEGWQDTLNWNHDFHNNWTEEANKQKEAMIRITTELQEARNECIQGLEYLLVQYVGIQK
ncbi:uncharacterized protein N7483_012236 [Penicillium malachiteum]|uniref:uncharacterized protein n=1 Tax=Penicillium malachiteum TaxID=1324776 RepID=UPI002546A6F3|nr:uncharacterized protein N7483_012236 [Penicillium malachiteum]KAJ5715055.1 hypothetical protein N7483_012236 [Penicillium malachiteum]